MSREPLVNTLPCIVLNPGRERSLQNFHPWVFSGAIQSKASGLQNGDLVCVRSADAQFLGIGHYFDQSIAVKLLSFKQVDIDSAFWKSAIANAYSLRVALGLVGSLSTNAFRLVNAEGDSLPGLIIDIYHKTAVIQCQTEGMARAIESISNALQDTLPLERIYCKGGEHLQAQYLLGESGNDIITENGLKFHIDWEKGQKTGFFLDQRENRARLASISSGKRILNCFCYSGAFSIYALSGGATRVDSVDASETAGELCKQNLALNFPESQHDFIKADCFDFLEASSDQYDIVIVDPPAFIKNRSALNSGIKGYDAINNLALRRLKPGGFVLTFSCSQLLDRATFREAVFKAARRARRAVQVVSEFHAAACHPVSLYHPEGQYLKGLLLRVS